MIHIEKEPWSAMVTHAEGTYPNECCGAMLGISAEGLQTVRVTLPLENAFGGPQGNRYELRPEDLLRAEREARARKLDLIGIYHSHPDCGAYFSETDLKNSCPWYSFVVLSVVEGRFAEAGSFRPDIEQTHAEKEEILWPKS